MYIYEMFYGGKTQNPPDPRAWGAGRAMDREGKDAELQKNKRSSATARPVRAVHILKLRELLRCDNIWCRCS